MGRDKTRRIFVLYKQLCHLPSSFSYLHAILTKNRPLLTMDDLSGNPSVPLPNVNLTHLATAPGQAVNSTAAWFESGILQQQAYTANQVLFVAVMVVLAGVILAQFPHAYIRIRSTSLWNGFRLENDRPADVAARATYSAVSTESHPPYRLRHLRLPLPAIHIPFFDLSLKHFLWVLALWLPGVGIAAWCQANFLRDASRSTLVVLVFITLAAALGVKAGGVGTWMQIGYTAVNFMHRWTGRLVLLLSTLHVVAYLVLFFQAGGEF